MQTSAKQQRHSLEIGVDHFFNQLKRTKDIFELIDTSAMDPQHYKLVQFPNN